MLSEGRSSIWFPLVLTGSLGGFLALTSVFLLTKAISFRKRNPLGYPLPPGPQGLPLIGNLFQLPERDQRIGYDQLCKEHGDIVYLEAMGQPIVLLGSLEKVTDLFEKRSSIYSSRGVLPAVDMMNLSWSLVILQYGAEWRRQRRTFHQQLGTANTVSRFQPIINQEISKFLRKLHEDPEDFLTHTRDLFGYMIMRIAYGSDDELVNEGLLRDGKKIVEGFSAAATPGRYMVNAFPILRHIPAWFPGAGFRKECSDIIPVNHRVLVESFESAWGDMKMGRRSTHPSMTASLMDAVPEDDPDRAERIRVAQRVCAVAYAAGSDTTNSTLMALFLALAMHPEVQAKAQQEIESVVGPDRLPTMDDKESLPYVSAVVKEVSRWHNPIPLIFHASSEDDVYDGYFIPKNSWVLMNIWALLHDPNTFEKPFEFNPDRYLRDGKLDATVLDPATIAFGYGRRICPARALAERTIFLVATALLATCNIYPPKDEAGNSIPLELGLSPQLETVVTPLPFKCDVRLRSPQHAKLF